MRVQLSWRSPTNQYNPPEVGMAEPRSAIANPTKKINMLARNQPQTMPAGPVVHIRIKRWLEWLYRLHEPAGIE